ncbi:MAG: ABC transporter ATP-binding protein [Endomicrobiales bacterium]|nr:ABC transporter ATP-binding protein [Endomicrobiales bacterium]
MIVVEVNNLTKEFNGIKAVDDITFSLKEGIITGMLGPNGAGKTTTIYMLLGLITQTSGSIRIFNKDIAKHRQEVLSQMNFSSTYVSLPSNLKVMENLLFFSYLYDVKQWKKRAVKLLEEFELSGLENKRTGQLSSGQITRLNLVKSLLNSPKFLCLDEPTSSLDPISAKIVRAKLKDMAKKDGITILYTSHNMHEVEQLCDEVIFLHKGKIKAFGTPEQLVQSLKQKDMENVFFELAGDGEKNEGNLSGGAK